LLALGAGLFTIALGVDELMALAPRQAVAGGAAGAGAAGGAGGRPAVRPYAGLIATAIVAVVVLGAIGVSAATDDAPPELGCNGSVRLCERRLDEVAIAATHNSMSSPQDGFLLPNQESGIAAQLRGGIRGLLIDMHVGANTPRGVYTVLQEGGKSRAKLEEAVGPEATRTALRLRQQIGYRGGGDERVYLCHGFCELGAVDAERALRDVRDFLAVNPGSVLVISVEDQVTPQQAAGVFERSGLLEYVWKGPVRPVPTLGEMVEADERVLVFGEDETAGVPWYQPVVSLAGDAIVGAEALVRWQHPARGLLAPADFIGVAEESGLIAPLGAWVLDEACRQAAAWAAAARGGPRRTVSVNLSPRQISHSDVPALLERALAGSGADPALIELEITESVLMEQSDAALATLRLLKELGVRLVLDDFGTGWSSLGYLKRFPLDALKIDREFVDGLGTEPEDTAIVTAVLSMASALDLDVIAEGVETDAQLAWLRDHGCGCAQGYLLGRPMPADELTRLPGWRAAS
ncbi:MAG TPA: EAL domain-containing protein, partial [Myxococcota bacterium]|nr:EAL domain-containing protein [Myxococcota bacterium]